MSCCGDPTAHQPPPVASDSVLKTLTASGESVECPDPIVAAAMLEATQLTDREREIILGVLGRDELLRRDQQLRVLQLKAELQNLRRKGALRPSTDLDTTGPDQDPDRYCRRCRVKLGRVINRGAYCRACRLKVCKACREYSLRTTDWVCTVCKKQMEIQAASGEWMNEFVKRPNKRRENRVCLPTADIIKRTIRRSWTISNPTPRWSAMRGSPELRPYNSLPRKQDINNYPSLALHQTKNQEVPLQEAPSPTYRRRSPRRTQSEDIYDDQSSSSQYRGISPITQSVNSTDVDNLRHSRMNPLSKLSDGRLDIERRRSPMRRSNEGSSEDGSSKEDGSPKSKGILTPETARKFERNYIEKRVSFESHVPYTKMSKPTPVLRTQSLIEGRVQNHLPSRYSVHQEDNSDNSEEATQGDVQDSREENNSIELCEIEPFSGTVFRKMMVRRRRQNNARSISGSATNCSTTENANVAIYRNPVLALTLTVAGSTIIFLKSKLSNQLSSDRITGLVPGWRRGPDSDLWDILLPEGDDYKLVFINSDGSSKEETSSREEDDNDSTSTTSSFPIDECDWDYFEPGTRPTPVINWGSPFGSPRVYRRDMVESPIGSPLVYRRRMRESDTGTDEDNIRQDSGSPASSDSLFQSRTLSEEISFDTNQSRREKVLDDTAALQCVHSEEVFTKPSCHACGAQTQFIPIPVPVPIPFPVPTLWPPHEPPLMVFGEQRFRVLPRNLWPYLSQSALIWPTLNANGGNVGTTMPATTDRDGCALETHKEPDNVPPIVEAEENITGYLECENRYASTSDSSSDCSDNSGSRVRRMYNVSGTERHSDDALPSSNVSSDNDEEDGRMSHSSVREDDMTSSGSADTDSDDTGTVADQKTRRFSRIFVVNKNLSSSSNSCSSSSDTDTSDNDTDTELDCTVILTNVKQLDEKDDVCDSKSSDKATENSTKQNKENYFSSPGLSDVSAESVNSSDVDQIKDFNDTSKDFISKENYGVNELTDNVDSYLSKANVEKNLCKNKQKLSDVINEKTFSFDDSDLIETELYTDEVAVIKLTKSDIEAIKKEYETDLPFGDEFKLNEAVHFKINKDEVDEPENNVRNENEEKESYQGSKKISSSSIKSNLTKGNTNKDFVSVKTSKKSTVTFNLSEESSNFENEKCEKITTELNPDDDVNVVSSEVDNTANINTKEETEKLLLCANKGDALIAHEKYESTSYDDINKSETSSESLTEDQVQTTHPLQGQIKLSLDIKDNVITTDKAVLEDEKGKTNIYNKTACSTIKTNMTLDGQNIENLEFRSISFTNILDNDDDNGSNQSSITETTQISDNDYMNEIKTLLESFDYQKTDDEITVSSILTSDTNVTDNVNAEKINNEYLKIDIFGDHIITNQEIKEHFNACEELPHPIEKINDIDEYIDIEKPLLDISQACSINFKSNTSNTEDDIADLMFFDEEDVKINDSMTVSDKVVVEAYNFQNMSDDDNNHLNKNGIKKDIETKAEGKNKFEELINSFDTDTLKDIENIDGYGYLKLDINDEDIKNITDNVEAVVINISDIDFTQSTYYFIESKKSVDRNLHDDSVVETCNKSSQISEENNNDHIGNGILSSKVVCDDRKKINAEDSQDIVILDNLANLDSVESEVEEQNDLLGTSTSITRLVLKANEFDNDSNRILDTLEESKMIDHKNVEKLDDTLELDLIIPSKIEENYSAIKNQNEVFSHITTEILGADIKTNEEINIKVDNFSEPSKQCNKNFQTIDAGLNLIDTTRNVDSESGFTHDNDMLKNETILTGFVEPTTTDLLLSLQNKKIKEITDKSVTNSSKINTTPSAPMGVQETVTDNIHENVKLFDEFGANNKIEYGLQTIAPVLANTTKISHNSQKETVNESHDNYALNSGSIDENTRDPSAQLDVKFEIRAYDTKDIDLYGEAEKSVTTNDSPNELNTVVSPCLKYELNVFDLDEIGVHEKCEKSPIISDTPDTMSKAVSPNRRFELSAFNNEEIDIYKESDISPIISDSSHTISTAVSSCMQFELRESDTEEIDNYEETAKSPIISDSPDTISTTVSPCMKFELSAFDNEEIDMYEESDISPIISDSSDTMSTAVSSCMQFELGAFDTEEIDIYKETAKSPIISDSPDTISTTVSPCMKFELSAFDNEEIDIYEESDILPIISESSNAINTAVAPCIKFEFGSFDEEEIDIYEDTAKSPIISDAPDTMSTALSPCRKFEINPFNTKEIDVFQKSEESPITCGSPDDSSTVVSPCMKFEIKSFNYADVNVLEEYGQSAITTDSCDEESTVVLPCMKFEIKSFDNEDGNVEESDKSSITADSCDEVSTVVLPRMKFEIKPFENEDANVLEESDKSAITTDSCDEVSTVVLPCMKFEIKSFDNEDGNVQECKTSAITTDSSDELNTVLLPRMKFEIKPFENEDANVLEEFDKSAITTDSCDEEITVVLPRMKFKIKPFENEDANVLEESDKLAITTDSCDEENTVVLPCMKFEIKSFDNEDGNVEESDKSAITSESSDELNTVLLPRMKFEIKPFDNEDANVLEESDKSAITCDEVSTVVLSHMKFEIKPFENEDANVLEESDKSAITCDEISTVVLPHMKFEIKPFENEDANVIERSDKLANATDSSDEVTTVVSPHKKFEIKPFENEDADVLELCDKSAITTDSYNEGSTVVLPCMKFEIKAFDIEDANVLEESDKSAITTDSCDEACTVVLPCMKFEIKAFDIEDANVLEESDKSAITTDSCDEACTVVLPCMKFEIKPFDNEDTNVLEESDKSAITCDEVSTVVLPHMKFEIKPFENEDANVLEESDKSANATDSSDEVTTVVSPHMKFEIKPFENEDADVLELCDKSAITTDSYNEGSTVVLPCMKFEIKAFDIEDANVLEESDKSAITTDSCDEACTVVLPCMKFEIKAFDIEDANVLEESDKSAITTDSCDEACTVVLPCMKFSHTSIKPFDNEDANVLEESDKSAITCDEVSTVVLPHMKFEIKPFENEDANVLEESDKSANATDSSDEVTTVVSPHMKFEIKPFENEDADVLELCDKSAITTDSYNELSTVVLPCMKFEIKAFDIEDTNVLEESDKSAIITDSCDEACTVVLPCMKFEIKPFDNEDANVLEESDKSAITCDEVSTVVLPHMKFEIKPFENEDANVLEESDKSANATDSSDEVTTVVSPHMKFEIKPFENEDADVLELCDKSAITTDSCDEVCTVVLPCMKFEIKPFDKEDANILEESDKSAITSNSSHEPSSVVSPCRKFELKAFDSIEIDVYEKAKKSPISTDSNDTTRTAVSPCMKFERKPFDNEEVNVFDEFKKSHITNDESYNISTVLSPYIKFEIKPFDTKEVNVYDESHESPITSNLSDKPPITNYPSDKLSTVASPCMKFEIKPFGEKTIDIFEETDKELQTENTEDVYETFERVVSPCMKFELKAFNTETINVYDESDDSLEDIRESCETFRNVVSPTMRFELKSFNTETINIYEESNDSNQPVAKKCLDIVPNRKDLNYLQTSNRAVVYSSNSFGDDDIDISRSHEIIKSFDKAGKMTDCMLDIGNEIEDNVDFLKNFDNIKLAQNFKFTLRSYGEDESKKHLTNKRDATTPNIIEKIFKRKRISENDESETHEITSEEICEKRLNKDLLVSKISSENPLISNISCPTIPHTDNDQLMDTVDVGETPVEAAGADHQRALSEWNEIRSIDAVNVEGKSLHARNDGVQPGAIVCGEVLSRHAARYTSLVMITQDPAPNYQQVSVVTSDTTTLVPGNDVIVRHTNWQEDENKQQEKIRDNHKQEKESVTVITGGDTLSAFEEGLADDDSWVENLSHDDEDEDEFATNSGTEDSSSGEEVTLTCSAAIDQEEDLRGYHRTAIDFTLHTIVEESCEESEVEQNVSKKKERPASATDLEKYFFFGLGDGMGPSLQSNREDAFSETSSIYSEGMESLGSEEVQTPNDNSDPAELASSRLEKYFLSGFMGFTAERRDSDGSVGSDSEGRPSPEQRRKRLVRARGTGRSHSSSLDNLDNAISEQTIETQMSSEHSSSSDSENYDETNSFEKPDGQFDTVKRKKNKKHKNTTSTDESKNLEITQEIEEKCSESDEDGHKTPQPEVQSPISNLTTTKNQQSRDSGFVGSCDDLLREQRDNSTPDFTSGKNELIKTELEGITEEKKLEEKLISVSTPPATSLTRKDSFNNWSSDEETNLMMCKMRQFFKTMVANSQLNASSKPSTPNLSCTIKPVPSPRAKRCKPPQLVYFENELTRLMKTVPGIREDQVREIVEYLSSEDTWSDSYDSSDYTSSDLEITTTKTVLQQQISDSCKQIINKFDNIVDDEGDEGDGGIIDESHGLNKETAFVYQKLVASFEKMAAGENSDNNISKVTPHSSPPLIAKVMHHIGSRLVALMHEVSSGESHASNSPKTKHYHRRLQHKISSASSTTTEDDYPDGTGDISNYDEHVPYNLLPRSRSHDLLVGEARILHQSTSGVSDITEEKEASDCERFSWRGSFESALLATDSRNRLSLLGGEASASASALAIAAKRRSAGDLLFTNKSLSREQLDRVRSCGSIGGANSEDKLWVASAIRPNRRRSSVPDATCGSGGSADGEDEDEDIESRATLPRSLQGGTPTTNSLPRLPTTISSNSIQKSQSHHFLSQNVKSARYRPPGFNRLMSIPKRAVSAPGLQPSHQRRGRRSQQNNVPNEIIESSEEKQASSSDIEQNTNDQEQVDFDNEYMSQQNKIQDYIAMIRECLSQPATNVDISNSKMEIEQEYQSEVTLANSNEEVQETYCLMNEEEKESHSNTDVMLDQILETLVSHGLELEFLLTQHMEEIQRTIPKQFIKQLYDRSDLPNNAVNVQASVPLTSDVVKVSNDAEELKTSSNRNKLTEKKIGVICPYNVFHENKTYFIGEYNKDDPEKSKNQSSNDNNKLVETNSKEINEKSEERGCLSTNENRVEQHSNDISSNIKISEIHPIFKQQEKSESFKKTQVNTQVLGEKLISCFPNSIKQSNIHPGSFNEEVNQTSLNKKEGNSFEKLPLTSHIPSCVEGSKPQTISDGQEPQETDLSGNGENLKETISESSANDNIGKILKNTHHEEKKQDEKIIYDTSDHSEKHQKHITSEEGIIGNEREEEAFRSQFPIDISTNLKPHLTELIGNIQEINARIQGLEDLVDNSKTLQEVNKWELEDIQAELVNSKNKSTVSKKSVKRFVSCLVPGIKCKSTNREEEDDMLQQKEITQSDDVITMAVTETSQDSRTQSSIDKEDKYNLPNLEEFHEILDTMSTVCTSPQSIQGGKIEPIPQVSEASLTVEEFYGQYKQQMLEDISKKECKPLIIISSTISKSVPEIKKTSEDGNNKLPLPLKDESGVSEAHSSPMLASPRNGTKSATTSPVTSISKRIGHDWHHEEDLDRIVSLHGRASLSTLGARSDSMASVYSGAGEGRYGSVAVRGQVEFGLQYNYKAGALEIQIKQCRDLAPVDIKRNRSDPYVKVYLLPDKSKSGKRKTKVKKHTLNPVFDECLKFHISLNGLETRTLWLTVWHSDMFGRNDFLGEVMMTLENKVFDDPTPKWYNLQERTEPFEDVSSYKGDIIVCLKFVPPDMTIQKKGKRSRGALHVLIKEAKSLTAVKANGTSDPFCKSYLLPDKGRSSKQKTPIARRTTNPVWNYTFVYDDVSLQELAERCLELTVWDHDRLASNEFLGGVRFSLGTGKHYGKPVDWMDASGREMSLWKNMLEKPNFWVEGSLSLRSSLESRGS